MMSNLTKKTELMGCGITTRNVYSEGEDAIIFGRISPNKRRIFVWKNYWARHYRSRYW